MEKATGIQGTTGKSCTSKQVSLIREQISILQAYQELTTALGRLPNCPLKELVKEQLDILVSVSKQETVVLPKLSTEKLRLTLADATVEVLKKCTNLWTINEVATEVASSSIKAMICTFPNIFSSILENDKRSPESPQ